MKLALSPKPKLSTPMVNYGIQNVSGKSCTKFKREFLNNLDSFNSVVPNVSVHSPMVCSTNLKPENIANIVSTSCMHLAVANVENSSLEELSKL